LQPLPRRLPTAVHAPPLETTAGRTARAAGYSPGTISAAQAKRVLSQAVGLV